MILHVVLEIKYPPRRQHIVVSIWDNPGYKLRIEDVKMKQMQHVNYLGNLIKDDGKCNTDIRETDSCMCSFSEH